MDQESTTLLQIDSLAEIDQFLDHMVANYRPARSWLALKFDADHNAIFFTSAWKDRRVPTYFAIDDDGDICLLLSSLYL
jgi:hypothetical protein